MKIAYLSNSFPEPVESYVWEEIQQLRKCGAEVVPCSVRHPQAPAPACPISPGEVEYVFAPNPYWCLTACWLLLRNLFALRRFILRALVGPEAFSRRIRTLVHTWIGAYLAARIASKQIAHIHVHHGYFASWVGMIAANILRAGFSMTLHGSDLLVRGDYLETKLAECDFCFTTSEFNRQYILDRYPAACDKVVLRTLGVDLTHWKPASATSPEVGFSILGVGRLHKVKNQEFLIRACHELKATGVGLRCLLAGEGPERDNLKRLIAHLGLQSEVALLGHVPREQLPALYSAATAVVLTSHSEGIPVALMEAMAMRRVVIAPRITGIPELVVDGVSGLLYSPGSVTDFIAKLNIARDGGPKCEAIRRAAREQIERNFNGPENLERFAAEFLRRASVDVSAQQFSANSALPVMTSD